MPVPVLCFEGFGLCWLSLIFPIYWAYTAYLKRLNSYLLKNAVIIFLQCPGFC